jgi:hypothetical protein
MSFVRSLSPLRSPKLQRHLQENIDIPYPFSSLHLPIAVENDHIQALAKAQRKLLVDKDGYFRVKLNVQDFTPDEIEIKAQGHTLMVNACHEEKQDEFGSVKRSLTRKYAIPFRLDMENIITKISKDFILQIEIPPKKEELSEKIVKIKLEE